METMAEPLELFDVTIIGAGPAGMFAAFYSGMRELKTKLIDANEELGGRLLRYPEKIIWDVGGMTPIAGQQLTKQLAQQSLTFDPTVSLGQHITAFERKTDGTLVLSSSSGERHWTRTVILAIGCGVREYARLDIEGAARYEATNLHYTVQELEAFRNKKVLISGGGDSALDWANALAPIAAEVTIVHRREAFSGHERSVNQMKQAGVSVRTSYVVKELHSDNGVAINQVTIAHVDTGDAAKVKVDALIVCHGMLNNSAATTAWGLETSDWHAQVSSTMHTNLPGFFAAGDFASHDGKVQFIAGAFSDAIMAINSAKLYMDPEADSYAYVSSHNVLFTPKNKELGIVAAEYI